MVLTSPNDDNFHQFQKGRQVTSTLQAAPADCHSRVQALPVRVCVPICIIKQTVYGLKPIVLGLVCVAFCLHLEVDDSPCSSDPQPVRWACE